MKIEYNHKDAMATTAHGRSTGARPPDAGRQPAALAWRHGNELAGEPPALQSGLKMVNCKWRVKNLF
jgi:hypothetical protein